VIVGVMWPTAAPIPATATEAVVAIVVGLIAIIGQLAIIRMVLGTKMTVGEAIGHGARRMPPYIVAGLIWAGPLIIAGYFIGLEVWRAPQNATGAQVVGAFLILLLLLFVGVRMMMTSSVASAERVGPLDIVRRSWQLTAGHWWKLFALLVIFLLVVIIVMSVVGILVGIMSSLFFDQIEPMTVGALVLALCTQLVSAVFTTILLVMLARIYAQLTGPVHADVSVPSSGT